MRRWSDATGFVKSTHELPPSQCSSGWLTAKYSGNGLFVAGSNNDTHVAFLLVPPVASQKPIEGWSIPSISLPGRISRREAYLPENVVAVSEGRERCVTGVPPPLFLKDLTTHRSQVYSHTLA